MMITGNKKTLERMRATSGEGMPVLIRLPGVNYGPDGEIVSARYADDYRGYRIRQYLWQGAGPVGRWFWQAQGDAELIGETFLYEGAEREARKQIVHDAMRAIDHMLDDPEWAEPVRNAMGTDA